MVSLNFEKNIIHRQSIWKYHPVSYFLVFLFCNTLLSYFKLSLFSKILIGLIGLILPLVMVFVSSNNHSLTEKEMFEKSVFKPLGLWVWILLIGLGILARFYHLVSLPVWPMWDDSYISFISIKQMQNWSWQLSLSNEGLPPFFFWLEAFFFKLVSPSQFTLWFFATGLSILVFLAGLWVSLIYFSSSLAFVFSLILGLSFWPLFLGKFPTLDGFFPFWEIILIGIFVCFLRHVGKPKEKFFAFGLGLCAGAGFYIWVVAVIPVIILSALLLWLFAIQGSIKLRSLLCFIFSVVLLFMPLAPEVFGNVFHGHVADHLVFEKSWGSVEQQLRISFSYLGAPLWGTFDKSYFNFGPLWGGYFNPILGSLFLLGWIEIYLLRQKTVFWWFIVFFVVCFIPALISNTVEMMRILTLFPFCVFLAALGVQALIRRVLKKTLVLLLSLCLILSLGLDAYHLLGPYHQWATPNKYMDGSKSPEHFRAFQVLEKLKAEKGIGLVFSDFYYDFFDQSLFVTTYDFNPVVNPTLDISKCSWAAALMAAGDRKDFLRHFPKAIFYDLSLGLKEEGSEMFLAVFDISSEDLKVLKFWVQAHQQISNLYTLYPFHARNPDYENVLFQLRNMYEQNLSDPFLRDCLMEKMIFTACQSSNPHDGILLCEFNSNKAHYSPLLDKKFANFFHKLALSYIKVGDEKQARKMMLKAAVLDPQYPLSRNLALMEKAIADRAEKKP